MERKTKFILAGVAAVVLAAALAAPFLLPKQTVTLDEGLPPNAASGESTDGAGAQEPDVVVRREGAWRDGEPGHHASGDIDLVTVDGETYLRFTDFELTAGPDVYLYLTQSSDPKNTLDVEINGVRVDVSTEADRDARLNERGSFFVPLDMSLSELSAYDGVAAWCDDFNVLFGSAALG